MSAPSATRWGGGAVLWSGLWVALMAVALATRPPLPVDETRYLAVAWEMWRDGNFLVPHLNGAPYSHKPPLLFWLIHAGWAAFGLNDWWPRLVAPLFGLASLFLTAALARRLWPGGAAAAGAAPLILLGCVFWTLFTTLTMFDMILAFCTLVALLGIIGAWRDGRWLNWGLMALGIGLGVLAKGPAIGLHVLPVAMLAPLWGPALTGNGPRGGWGRWTAGVAGAVAGGVALALAWAVPAAIEGGAAYGDAIFWGQSAGRMVDSFAHGRPWWWFAALLPALVVPWILWPPLWRAAAGARQYFADGGLRFCLAWFVPAFVAFSMISGKQPHYLLPEFPALALAAAFALAKTQKVATLTRLDTIFWSRARRDMAFPALALGLVGLGALLFFSGLGPWPVPERLAGTDAAWMLVLAATGAGAVVAAPRTLSGQMAVLTGLTAIAVISVHLAARPVLARAFDLRPLAAQLRQWEADGMALAHFGTYHGQFNFLGRLRRPVAPVGLLRPDLEVWLASHPRGKVISYRDRPPDDRGVDLVQPFRGRFIVVWDRDRVAAEPTIANRNPRR